MIQPYDILALVRNGRTQYFQVTFQSANLPGMIVGRWVTKTGNLAKNRRQEWDASTWLSRYDSVTVHKTSADR